MTHPGPRVGVFPSMHDVNGEPGEAVPGRLRSGRRRVEGIIEGAQPNTSAMYVRPTTLSLGSERLQRCRVK